MLARQHPDGLITPPPVAIAYHIIRGLGGGWRRVRLKRDAAAGRPVHRHRGRRCHFRSTAFPHRVRNASRQRSSAVIGGCAANAAVAARGSADRARSRARVGSDDASRRILAALAREGVDCERRAQRSRAARCRSRASSSTAHGEKHDRDLPRRAARRRQAARPADARRRHRHRARRQPLSGLHRADLRGGARARHPGRCSTPTPRGAEPSAVRHRLACRVFIGMPARRDGPGRSRRGAHGRRAHTARFPRGDEWPRRHPLAASGDAATNARLRGHGDRHAGRRRRLSRRLHAGAGGGPRRRSRPCASALPRRRSNARASAGFRRAPPRRSRRLPRRLSRPQAQSRRAAPDCRPGSSCASPRPAPTWRAR